MQKTTVRPATTEDLEQLVVLATRIVAGWGLTWDQRSKDFLARQISAGNVLIADWAGEFAGFTSFVDQRVASQFPQGRAHITNTMIVESFRRRGIAEELKRHLIQVCKDRRIARITTNHLKTNSAIINLSRKLGFTAYIDDSEQKKYPDHVLLELLIKKPCSTNRTG